MITIERIRTTTCSDWRIVGIDPAPGSDSTICFFDGDGLSFNSLKANELLSFIQSCKRQKKVLITWDAPLTGPSLYSTTEKRKYVKGDFTQRDIEKFFMRSDYGEKPPPGISTQGYSGCQHWTITKTFTGLPLLGPYCQQDGLPFHHIVSAKEELNGDKPKIVEVHPALAMYLWIKNFNPPVEINDWRYKKDKEIQTQLLCLLKDGPLKDISDKIGNNTIRSDDHLDALVAWALGYYFAMNIENGKKVKVMGDQKTGSMLLPYDKALFNKFKNTYMQA